MIVHDGANHACQECAALGGGPVKGEQDRRRHMQPLGHAAHAVARFVHVLDGRLLHPFANDLGHGSKFLRLALFHGGDGCR